MARGRKNLTPEEELEKITLEIQSLENALVGKRDRKQELEGQIRENRLAELDALIVSSGMSLEEVKNLLVNKISKGAVA